MNTRACTKCTKSHWADTLLCSVCRDDEVGRQCYVSGIDRAKRGKAIASDAASRSVYGSGLANTGAYEGAYRHYEESR